MEGYSLLGQRTRIGGGRESRLDPGSASYRKRTRPPEGPRRRALKVGDEDGPAWSDFERDGTGEAPGWIAGKSATALDDK